LERTHDAVSGQREFSLDSDVIPVLRPRGGELGNHGGHHVLAYLLRPAHAGRQMPAAGWFVLVLYCSDADMMRWGWRVLGCRAPMPSPPVCLLGSPVCLPLGSRD